MTQKTCKTCRKRIRPKSNVQTRGFCSAFCETLYKMAHCVDCGKLLKQIVNPLPYSPWRHKRSGNLMKRLCTQCRQKRKILSTKMHICPYCGSSEMVKHGVVFNAYSRVQRYQCKKCLHTFIR